MASHTMVMRGSLQEFELLDVLQCVGTSRQHTVIELQAQDGRRQGAIAMKAGQVLTVEHGTRQGRPAFFELLDRVPDHFIVYRLPDFKAYPRPLGPLTNLLLEAAERASEPLDAPTRKSVPPPTPAPAPRRPPSEPPPPPPPALRLADTSRVTLGPPRIVVAVTSPKGGVGKTTITLNLALSLAERGVRTVVIDADINGDLLSLMDAHDRAERGAFDLLDDLALVEPSLRPTAEPRLRVLPARGPALPVGSLMRPDLADAWRGLCERVAGHAEITLVDCPAGMFHTTRAVLRAATHVVGIFQADMVSSRSFPMFLRALDTLPEDERPELAGVVVNMFQRRADSSVAALRELCQAGARHRLFDTTIPRSEAFWEAGREGVPLRVAGDAPSPVAYLFDMLADEVCTRVGVARKTRPRLRSFLL